LRGAGFHLLVTTFSSTAFSRNIDPRGQCRLIYKDSIYARGPCTTHQMGDTVSIQGTVEENGQHNVAIINTSKNEGVPSGAGIFTPRDEANKKPTLTQGGLGSAKHGSLLSLA
jgi:hypothetical protein